MLGSLFDDEDEIDIKNLGFSTRKVDVKSLPLPRPQCRLSGISNQGATCYLNSLLQTLLFTPEFRENLFLLSEKELGSLVDKDKEDAKVRVIPLELQRLFVQLLLSDRQSVLTTDLTNSFGWTNNEELQQHDVQELNRILFSAIEESLVGTSGSDLIQTLYHGKIVNQIICDVCGKVSEREEDFLDLCVTVAGSESLENGLADSYCQMETMNGQNQYRCEKCNKLVDAKKGAKLRCLPQILTISLLRFSFDFVKLERYKETGKYVFPMRLNMAKYCEQASIEEEWYDLFSVVIHRGGAHGGHYYAYIRDVDAIGQWTHPDEETLQLPADPSTGEVDFIQCDSPIELIQAVLASKPNHTLSLDKLGAEINSQTGVSWSKRFKRQYGPLNKFLMKYDDKFVLDSSSNQVSLRQYHTPRDGSGDPTAHSNTTHQQANNAHSSKKRSTSPPPELGHCWFSFDDVRVHPIREQEIQKTFSGKSSAYMLFYRKTVLERPPEAMVNASYQIPDSLIADVLAQNEQLCIEREEYDKKMNELTLQIHFHQWYYYNNGALHPKDYQSSFLQLVIDRRKNVEDLKIAIMELGGELIDSEFVIHRMKEIPSGFHLYDDISVDNDKQIKDLYIQDDTMLFVWNGMQVDGHRIQTGILYEPVLLNISTGSRQHAVIRGFPRNMSLKALQRHLCDNLNLDCDTAVMKRIVGEDERKIVTFTFDQYDQTLSELKLKDGDELIIEEESETSSPENVTASSHQEPRIYLTIENRCKNSQKSGAKPSCRLEAEKSQTIAVIKNLAITKCGLEDTEESYRLRVEDEHLGLRPPMYEQLTIEDYGLSKFSLIVLEQGEAPKSNEMTLTILTSSCDLDLPDFDITLDRNTTVEYCLQCALNWSGLTDHNWHLRKTNWCGEAADLLDDMDSKLETCLVQHGDRLMLEKGRIPPKGFIPPSIWLYPTLQGPHHQGGGEGSVVSWITQGLSSLWNGSQSLSTSNPILEPFLLGEVEISLQSTLEDLKIQIMTLSTVSDFTIPTTDFLRVRDFYEGRLGGVLRGSDNTLQKLKLKNCDKLAIQVLPQEECLNINQMVLEVTKRIPNTKTYEPATEVLWDTSQGATVQSLKQTIAEACFEDQEHISIAKHFPKKFEWMVIREHAKKQMQQQKSKKKATKINLRHAPYCIQDGDTIGVKNLQFDPLKMDDFSTEADELGRAELQRQAEEKRKERKERKEQGTGGIDFSRPKRPEVGLTIKVENFRS